MAILSLAQARTFSSSSRVSDEGADNLTSGQRKDIAVRAAQARWDPAQGGEGDGEFTLPKATHQGKMAVGSLDLDCYVLADGRRVFHKRGMAKALGMKSEGGNVFMRAMQRRGLGSELGDKLIEKIENPINFKPLTQDLAHGYDADVLPAT